MPFGLFIGAVFVCELIIVLINSKLDLANIQILSNPFTNFTNMTNTQALGSVLYTDYILYFQLSGVILLVAMIGSIVLTLRDRTGVRRQVIGEQLERDSSSTVLKEVESGEGVDI
jgi:NADH-quinone oxidoreductase subunit J